MGAPSRAYDRVANLNRISSSAGLQAMHGGRISSSSARKIRNAIEWLLASASEKYVFSATTKKFHKWKLSFLTLTLPTQGTMCDKDVKAILNSFLTLCKYNYGLRSYIWKAEPQRRGAIHFHITSDCYMWKNSVRFEWNRLLAKSGLLNGHTDAPSTKIHSTYRVKNMAAYLTKYFIKKPSPFVQPPYKKLPGDINCIRNGQPVYWLDPPKELFYIRPISGRLWGCSHTLSKARSLSYTVDVPEMRALNDELRHSGASEKQKTYCNFYQLPDDYYDKLAPGQLKHDYNFHRATIRKRDKLHQFEVWDHEGQLITDARILKKLKATIK